ncbi:hypothetical protein JCM8547_003867 [Rhodosporidiobolus lusitaniae]
MSSSTYAPVPTDEKSSPSFPSSSNSEKPPLPRLSSSQATARDQHTQGTSTRPALLKAAVLTAALVLLGVGGGAALFCSPDAVERAWEGARERITLYGCGAGAQEERTGEDRDEMREAGPGRWRWWKRALEESEGGVEEFSTSTLKDGRTSTFVKTTRPIVNPGGFTIGTLTGYVPTNVSTTATASATSSSSSSSTVSTPDTFAVSSLASSAAVQASGPSTVVTTTTTATVTETETEPASTVTTTSTETITAAPSSSLSSSASPSTMFFEARQRAKRSSLVDAAADSSSEIDTRPSASSTGVEEFSTSTNTRNGQVYTLVKTTRPIVNQGGYTFGTLDGAWVDVAKQTDRSSFSTVSSAASATVSSTTAEVTATPISAPAAEERKRSHQREELRKRDAESA